MDLPMGRPLVSIVVPTRDRPAYLQQVLHSLTRQRYTNFEVIVCDNSVARAVQDVVVAFEDSRFRYIRAPGNLSAPDNWNLGCDQAIGEFIMVLSDKFALSYDCIARLESVRHSMPAKIYTWYQDIFYLGDDTESFTGTYYRCDPVRIGPAYYDLKQVLQKRLAFDCPRGTDGAFYSLGKMLCLGVYHHSLVHEIKRTTGALFHPLAPEYAPMTAACILSQEPAVDLGVAGVVGIIPKVSISTGNLMATNPGFARGFLQSMVPDMDRLMLELPIPHVFQSHHNIVAYTMLSICRKLNYPADRYFNSKNLIELCRQDMEGVSWQDEASRQEALQRIKDAAASNDSQSGEPLEPQPPAGSFRRWTDQCHSTFNDIEDSFEHLMQRVDQSPY
jgi:hypothetical protein